MYTNMYSASSDDDTSKRYQYVTPYIFCMTTYQNVNIFSKYEGHHTN